MDPTYVAGLHNLLSQTVAPDTSVIKAATTSLNQNYYKDPACVPALFEIIASSPDHNIRQLAAIELRKRISQGEQKLWIGLSDEIRLTIKSKILEAIVSEQNALVRHSTARVIAAIADYELPLHSWSQLLPFIQQTCTSPTSSHREVGIYVLYSVLETVMEVMKSETQNLLSLFSNLLVDSESKEVRATTVRALGSIAQFIEATDKQDVKSFQKLVPQILITVNATCEADDDEGARYGFDAIETLLIIESPLLAKNIPELVEFCLRVGANKNIDESIRQMALNALNWTIKYKKSKVQSLGLAKPILEALLPIGSEADPDDNDEDSPSRLAFRAVDALATVLPPMHVFPTLHELVTMYMKSPDPGLRKAAMMAFGVTIEGCSEFIRPHMNSLWPLIDAGLSDPEPVVRKAACIAFACICEWLEEECAERHEVLLPVIIRLTDDPETQGSACTALDAYLEILELQIAPYLGMIMQQLTKLLSTAPLSVKSIVTGAIGSAAHAAKANFAPYFEQSINQLRPFLSLTAEGEEQDLRGISTDAIGTIAEAVGKDTFRNYFPEVMKSAFDGVTLGSARLKECSFLFMGVMARVFGDEFAPYVGHVVPLLIESLNQAETGDDIYDQFVAKATDAYSTGQSASDAIDSAEAHVVDIDPSAAITVNSAIAIEKEIAADTMGTIFSTTRAHFLPHLESCTLVLIESLTHYYEGIRKSAITSLLEFVRTFYEMSDSPLWEAGAQVSVPLHDKVRDLVKAVLTPLMDMWDSEDDKSVVSTLCSSLAETLAKVGPGMLEGHLEGLCSNLQNILEGKSLCQQDPDADDDEEPLEEQAEFDAVLIAAASDLVAALAAALGPDFVQVFGMFLSPIAKYAAKNRSVTERASSVGTLGEIIVSVKGGVTAFTSPLMQVLFASLSDEDAEVRSNAAFAIGVLIENSEADLSDHFLQILNGLKPAFDVTADSTSEAMHGRDNAAGAVARMILKKSTALPLDQVLPVLYSALPLKADYLENAPIYRSILQLFQTNHDLVMNYVDTLLPAFAVVLGAGNEDQVSPDVRAGLVQLVAHLNQQIPAKVSAAGLGHVTA